MRRRRVSGQNGFARYGLRAHRVVSGSNYRGGLRL